RPDITAHRKLTDHVFFFQAEDDIRHFHVTGVQTCTLPIFDAMAGSLVALRLRMSADDRAVLDRLATATSELAALALNGPGRTPPAEYRQRLAALDEHRERLEADISARSAEFRAQSQPVTLAAVQAAIPNRTALVEFAVYQ